MKVIAASIAAGVVSVLLVGCKDGECGTHILDGDESARQICYDCLEANIDDPEELLIPFDDCLKSPEDDWDCLKREAENADVEDENEYIEALAACGYEVEFDINSDVSAKPCENANIDSVPDFNSAQVQAENSKSLSCLKCIIEQDGDAETDANACGDWSTSTEYIGLKCVPLLISTVSEPSASAITTCGGTPATPE